MSFTHPLGFQTNEYEYHTLCEESTPAFSTPAYDEVRFILISKLFLKVAVSSLSPSQDEVTVDSRRGPLGDKLEDMRVC